MKPHNTLPRSTPPDIGAVVLVLLSTDWPELAPPGPLRVLATSLNARHPPHALALPGGKVDRADRQFPGGATADVIAAQRELAEETGLRVPLLSSFVPVWQGWMPGEVTYFVRAFRVVPGLGRPLPRHTDLRPEPGCRVVWVEPSRLLPVCPYALTNAPAIEAAWHHAQGGTP